ncbi:MAG: peptide chain release factor N(5)-glutamine methyltransferase [Clostridia bacterium]|nr:peptide chain release factor N(5)-glutamine methyltransferase [Clostridia bacterium]
MKNCKQKTTSIGGQAVIEGVMMRGRTAMATAVRAENGQILLETNRISQKTSKNKFLKLPIVRGVVAFFSSLVLGTKTLTRSASVFGEEETSKFDKFVEKKTGISATDFAVFIAVALGLVLSLFLFFFLPQFIADLLPFESNVSLGYFLVEGLIRIVIFVLYILLTSLIKDVRRTYMYHGAEHKTISCYESGKELTVENVKTCSRVHDRCGTTFTFLVMIISILVFSIANVFLQQLGVTFTGLTGKLLRFLVKLLLLPFVSGISYEILKLLAKTKSKFVIIFKAPGLLLQRITTREPSDDMIEVAITAFNKVLKMDENQEIAPVKFNVFGSASTLLAKVTSILKSAKIDELVDGEWIVCRALNIKRSQLNDKSRLVSEEECKTAIEYALERAKGTPLAYIFKDADFYGFKINVDKSVLIPRPETEELCALIVKENDANNTVLDMCTGSGAIAIALNKLKGFNVTAVDVSEDAINLAKTSAVQNNASVTFILSNMFENVTDRYNIIVSNPPYIKTSDLSSLQQEVKKEPVLALDGGESGLDFYNILCDNACKYLLDGGALYMECGIGQAQDVKNMFDASNNYLEAQIFSDINGVERIVKVVKK